VAEHTLDAVTTALIDVKALMALCNDQVSLYLNIARTTTQALAAMTRHDGK